MLTGWKMERRKFERIFQQLSIDLNRKILGYIIHVPQNISFRKYEPYEEYYDEKFMVVTTNQKMLRKKNHFISEKYDRKTKTHLFYIIQEKRVQCCTSCGDNPPCVGYDCRGGLYDEYYFKTKHIAQTLNVALYLFSKIK